MLRPSSLAHKVSRWRPLPRPSATTRNTLPETSSCFFSTKLSPKEEHDRQVAAAQVLARKRSLQKSLQHEQRITQDQQQKHAKTRKKLQNENQNTLVHSIQHWLSKDASFFSRTMQALNLNALNGSNTNTNTSDTHDDPNAHPLQVVWNHYRQLYFDSIPSFREYLETSPESMQTSLDQLEKVGFGDPKWSKRYRQVRGYRVQQEAIVRQLAKQQLEVTRRQDLLQQAQRGLGDLQEMERLFQVQYSAEQRKTKKKETPPAPRQPSPSEVESSTYVFSNVLAVVSSFWSPTTTEETTTTPPPPPPKEIKTLGNSKISGPTRLQKRIRRKELAVEDLKENVQEADTRLEQIRKDQQRLQLPLKDDEYEQAQQVVQEARNSICAELAQHMQQRHAQLIEQYQTLDSQTDLTKPHDWYSYARLDRRKVIHRSQLDRWWNVFVDLSI
jgi:hypothetical protein